MSDSLVTMAPLVDLCGQTWTGWSSANGQANELLAELLAVVEEDPKPVHQVYPWRRTYRVRTRASGLVYVKLTDEDQRDGRSPLLRFIRSEVHDHMRAYPQITRLGIATPEVLLAVCRRRGPAISQSLLVTRALPDCTTFLSAWSRDIDLIMPVVPRLADYAARLHQAGFYLSLDLGNILVRTHSPELRPNPFLIDLPHMRRGLLGQMPERRRLRNLSRFSGVVRREATNPADAEAILTSFDTAYAAAR